MSSRMLPPDEEPAVIWKPSSSPEHGANRREDGRRRRANGSGRRTTIARLVRDCVARRLIRIRVGTSDQRASFSESTPRSKGLLG